MRPEFSLIFDLGKTNKKCFVFDRDWEVVDQTYANLPWSQDEGGDPCEDLQTLSEWVGEQARNWQERYPISKMNVSTYGASLVHLGEQGEAILPLYDYLKSFPNELEERFLSAYGPQQNWSRQTASPWLGMLNSGLQLYWLKHHRPKAFSRIQTSLHLPQFVTYLLHGQLACEYTSIGCHTGLWDMEQQAYHAWVKEEGLADLFPNILPTHHQFRLSGEGREIFAGIGVHDSSAALVPYLLSQTDPFLLLSTGTWSIALNPFNQTPLTDEELAQDCLQFLQADGKKVKASRLFLGQEYADQVARLNAHFQKNNGYDREIAFSSAWQAQGDPCFEWIHLIQENAPDGQPWKELADYETAYHQLIWELVQRQVQALNLVSEGAGKRLLIDGGFVDNAVFLELLQRAMPNREVWTSRHPLGSAFGALLLLEEKPQAERVAAKLKLRRI